MIPKPFGNQILVEPQERKQVLIAQGQKPRCEYGMVVAVGKGVQEVQVGEMIGFTKWGVNELVIEDGTPDGKKYYFVPEDSRFILARIGVPK